MPVLVLLMLLSLGGCGLDLALMFLTELPPTEPASATAAPAM